MIASCCCGLIRCLIYVEDGLVKIKTEAETYGSDYQISELEESLPEPPFFSARRALIANLRKVRARAPSTNGTFMLLLNDPEASQVQVSERQSRKLRELLRL